MTGSPAYNHMQKRAVQAREFMTLYADGVPLTEIAERVGLSIDVIKYWSTVYVLPENRRKKPKQKPKKGKKCVSGQKTM